MLHHLEILRLAPDGRQGRWREALWHAFAAHRVPLMAALGQELTGAWMTPIGAGNSNELTVLWSVRDQQAWAEYVAETAGLTPDGPLRDWRSLASEYVEIGQSRLLLASPGWDVTLLGRLEAGGPVAAVAPAGGLYQLEITQFTPEGRAGRWREDYWPEFRSRLAPTLGRLGVDLLGAWETAPGSGRSDEMVFLYRVAGFDDWRAYLERIAGAGLDPVLRERRGEMWVWREQWYTQLMLPAPPHGSAQLGSGL